MRETHRHRLHVNSLLAYFQGKEDLFSKRERDVLLAVKALGSATDREIMMALGFTDMNSVRPRISELIDDGVLEEKSSILDPITSKNVRTVRLKRDPREAQAQFDLGEVVDTLRKIS